MGYDDLQLYHEIKDIITAYRAMDKIINLCPYLEGWMDLNML